MSELNNFGISPENFNFSDNPNEELVKDYHEQFSTVFNAAWSRFLPWRINQAVIDSNLIGHIAETTANTVTILGMQAPPRIGLLNGVELGKMNHQGYCWQDVTGLIWIALDELWMGDVAESIADSNNTISSVLKDNISSVIAEEVFHAYVYETNPTLAKETELANNSKNPDDYWSSPGEQAAKEFASLYIEHINK